MKYLLSFITSCYIITPIFSQTLGDYTQLAVKNFNPEFSISKPIDKENTTALKFGFFVNPQYTISGAQRAYAQLQQQFPLLGKANAYRKIRKLNTQQRSLDYNKEKELLRFKVKTSYYKMYAYQKQKQVYVKWTEEIRKLLKDSVFFYKKDPEGLLKKFKYEAKLSDLTKELQIVDGNYQNEVIVFNELIGSENIDEPNLPFMLAMSDEEVEFEYPDPLTSASYLSFKSQINQLILQHKAQSKLNPEINLGLRYIYITPTPDISFELPKKDIFEPQLTLKWNLFTKPKEKLSSEKINSLLDQRLTSLTRQLQKALNEQISARIAYDTATKKLEDLNILEKQFKEEKTILNSEKILQISSLKHTFEIEQFNATASYYLAIAKTLLYF